MQVEVFTFCDFAQDNGGKLLIAGSFDTINSKEFPAHHPLMSLAIKLRFSIEEGGKHKVHVTFNSLKKSAQINPIDAEIGIDKFNFSTATVNLISILIGVKFEHEDTFFATLEVDGKEVSTTPLYIALIK